MVNESKIIEGSSRSIPIFFLKKKIKLGIEGDLTSYLYESTFGFNSWDLHRQAQKKKKEDLAADPLKPELERRALDP